MHKLLPLTLLVILGGCNLAPKHFTPALSTPAEFPPEVAPAGTRTDAVSIGWQDFYHDERLRELIALALDNNRDLRIAVQRIEEARGLYRIQRSNQLPQLGLTAGATRSRIGTASLNPAQTGGAGPPINVSGFEVDSYDIGVGVTSFELDFWGRVRNLSEAARSQYLSTVAAERAFRISLIRDLATAYISSRSLAEQAEQAERTVASREEGLRIAKLRLDAGVTSALDYRQADSLLTQAEAQLASLKNQRAQQRNIVRLLVGAPIDEESLAPARLLGDQGIVVDIDAGLPSDLLFNRPDIIAAEENLRAARANIGAARAAFFPTISLTGTFGFASTSLDNLLSDEGQNWSFGPSLGLPIFDWGARKGDLTVARARESIEVATYERTVQIAFREVSDALANRRYLAEQIAAQQRAVDAQMALTRLATRRYQNGVAQFLEVLDAERNLFVAQQTLIQLRGAELNSLVSLHAALGGGLGTPLPPRDRNASLGEASLP
jgi:multidrug efflux system outer membrane protein